MNILDHNTTASKAFSLLPLKDNTALKRHFICCLSIFIGVAALRLLNYQENTNMLIRCLFVAELGFFWWHYKIFNNFVYTFIAAVLAFLLFAFLFGYAWLYMGLVSPYSIFFKLSHYNIYTLIIAHLADILLGTFLYIMYTLIPLFIKCKYQS